MNEKAWKILFPPHSLSVESRALVLLWSDVWLGLRLFRFPRTKQATSIHPLQNRWLYVSCWKNFCFCSADSDVDFIFIFMKNPFWFFWSVDPFFFSSHLFCSPCWQIWMNEASVLSVLSEPCAACSHWQKIKLKIHIFSSRFELA